jgi:hypothetical protein
MFELDLFFSLQQAQQDPLLARQRCWPFSRVTGWKIVRDVMESAGVYGPQACPKGLRHGAAIAMLAAGVSINLIKRYLGHSKIATTEIYLNVSGPEERELLAKFWQSPGRGRERNVFWSAWLATTQQFLSRLVAIVSFPPSGTTDPNDVASRVHDEKYDRSGSPDRQEYPLPS